MKGVELLLLGALIMPVSDFDESHCSVPEETRKWLELLAENPNDPIIIRLYALRYGLCHMMEHELIGMNQAVLIFDQEMEAAIEEQRQRDDELQQRSRGNEL